MASACIVFDGRLQSLDWTSGLDWWTDVNNHFYALQPNSLTRRSA